MTQSKKATQSQPKGSHLGDMPKLVAKAYNYHLRQFSTKEIAKQIDVSFRTVQRWKTEYNFEQLEAMPVKELETIPQKALKMSMAGLSYSQIAKKLKRCKATIYNYIKAEKQKDTN